MNIKLDKKNRFYVIILAIIIIALVWAFASATIITKSFQKKAKENKLDNKKIFVEDLLITETKDGKKYWEIFADKGQYADSDKIAFVTNSIGNFYEDDEVKASFQSPRATINSETGKIVMYDRSKLIYKDFTSIIADEFDYDGSDKPIYAKGNVIIEKPGEYIIKGDNAIVSDEMTKIKVNGKVITTIFEKGK